MQSFAVRHQLGHIAFLPPPTERLGLDCKIGRQKVQELLYAGIFAGIGKPDTMPRMPFQQMGHIPRTGLICSSSTGSIEHAVSPCLERMIVAADEAEFWRSRTHHRRKFGISLVTFEQEPQRNRFESAEAQA